MGYTIYFSTITKIDSFNQERLRDAAVRIASHAYHDLGHAYTVIKDRGGYLQLWTVAGNAEPLEISYDFDGFMGMGGGFCKTFRRDFTFVVAAVLAYAHGFGWVTYDSDDNTCGVFLDGLLYGKELALAETQAELDKILANAAKEHLAVGQEN